MKPGYYKFFLLILCCLVLAACSSKPKPEKTAADYFKKGEAQFESGLYDDAIASWEQVRDTFYSPELSMLAELKIAEAYYVSKRYEEAAVAFQDFLTQHPNDFRAPVILYRMGLSYYKQILSADRDQTNTENALRSFQQLVQRYPDDPNAQEAGYLILRCKTRLAEHEVYVGWFYLMKRRYHASIKRLKNVLESFPDYYYRDEAYYYLVKAYTEIGRPEDAQVYFKKLTDEFPGSDYTDDARKLIEND